MRFTMLISAAAIVAAATTEPALAWGPEGHAIVAEIAESRLTPVAERQVAELLELEAHHHLDEIASWADAYL
jgi:S1/P1 Nuclease